MVFFINPLNTPGANMHHFLMLTENSGIERAKDRVKTKSSVVIGRTTTTLASSVTQPNFDCMGSTCQLALGVSTNVSAGVTCLVIAAQPQTAGNVNQMGVPF